MTVIALGSDAHGALFLILQGSRVLVEASYGGPVPADELRETAAFLWREGITQVVLEVPSQTPRETVDRMTAALRAAQVSVSTSACAPHQMPRRDGDIPEIGCNDGPSCFQRGAGYFSGADPRPGASADDLRKATRYFEAACDAEYERGCNAAGNMYRAGWGVSRDLARARSLYARACIDDATTPEACFNLRRIQRHTSGDR